MTKKVVWKNTRIEGDYRKYAQNIHVENNGEIISSILREIDIEGDFVYITVDVEFTRTFEFYGDFLVSNLGDSWMEAEGKYIFFYDDEIGVKKDKWEYVRVRFIQKIGDKTVICVTLFSGERRLLFKHPKGSKAAFEHMKNTTIEDDWHTLPEHLQKDHGVLKIFSNL